MTNGFKIGDSKVLESREAPDGSTIRRRRETSDGRRFTTYERVEMPTLMVRKSSGTREPFDRDKLLSAVTRSVGRLMNAEMEVENVVDLATARLTDLGREEIASREIGEAVLDVLAEVNEVAYVRFASVFLSFQSLDDFEQIIREQRKKRGQIQ